MAYLDLAEHPFAAIHIFQVSRLRVRRRLRRWRIRFARMHGHPSYATTASSLRGSRFHRNSAADLPASGKPPLILKAEALRRIAVPELASWLQRRLQRSRVAFLAAGDSTTLPTQCSPTIGRERAASAQRKRFRGTTEHDPDLDADADAGDA